MDRKQAAHVLGGKNLRSWADGTEKQGGERKNIMEGDERKRKILEILQAEKVPVSGTELAGKLGVSRQVIVQDIALLRAGNRNILSTNKGYILFDMRQDAGRKKRTYKVKHEDGEILDELNTVVDLGGKIRDVAVEHEIYGQISVELNINSRMDAETFVKKVEEYKTRPLNNLTHGVHFHTVEADSEEILDGIEDALKEKGYLVSALSANG